MPPTVVVDLVIFRLHNDTLEVLLVKRSEEPFKGRWSLPGGYSAAGSTTLQTLASVAIRKVGISIHSQLTHLEQLYTFDTVADDPRGHCVSVTYMGCGREITPGVGTEHASFHPVKNLPTLAYDHAAVIAYAHNRLIAKLLYTTVVSSLLPQRFTLRSLQRAYEIILDKKIDKRNFRKKFLSLNLIRETNKTAREGAHRPAKLFTFTSKSLTVLARSLY